MKKKIYGVRPLDLILCTIINCKIYNQQNFKKISGYSGIAGLLLNYSTNLHIEF